MANRNSSGWLHEAGDQNTGKIYKGTTRPIKKKGLVLDLLDGQNKVISKLLQKRGKEEELTPEYDEFQLKYLEDLKWMTETNNWKRNVKVAQSWMLNAGFFVLVSREICILTEKSPVSPIEETYEKKLLTRKARCPPSVTA